MLPLVSTAWLADQLPAADLLLFDASWYVPAEQRDARALYRQAHLPGARFFDIDAIADTESRLPHTVPSTAQFERLIGALGVRNEARVVFYDQQGMYSAPRAWWLMQLFGHERSAVLDGGLPRWRSEGRAVEQDEPGPPPVTSYQARFNARLLRGLGDLLDNLRAGGEVVLDARARARFHAEVPEPRAGLRGGHIPGSRSLPFTEVLNDGQTMKEPAQLRALFAAHGIDATSRVVTTCGSGLTAAVLTLALTVAGLPRGALYDGSWTEWGSRTDTPVEVE
jgi:thiosulfate/3-mercaptopyruvate sulfurtransferase